MMMKRYPSKVITKLSISALLAFVSQPAWAQATQHTPETCAQLKDPQKRLSCFDTLFQSPEQAPETISKGEKPQISAPITNSAPLQDEVDQFGKRETNIDKLEMIEVLITEAYRDVYGKWVFVTTNAQIWHQSDLKRASIPNLPAKAQIKRGAFGSFRLVFEENRRAFTVTRRN